MNEENLKILVIGSGGREHTLAKICNKSEKVEKVIVAPGNGGIAKEFDTVALDVENNEEILSTAKSMGIDFVVVGPEVPLCNGAVDILSNAEFPLTDLINQQPALKAVKLSLKIFWQNIKSQPHLTVIFKPVNRH